MFRIVLPIPLFHWPTGVRAELTSPDFFMRRFDPSRRSDYHARRFRVLDPKSEANTV